MIDKIENYIKKKTDSYEIYYGELDSETFELNKNKLDSCIFGSIKGLGIRVFNEGRIGFSSSLNINNYKNVADAALKIAKLNNKDKNFKGFVKRAKYPNIKSFYNELADFDEQDIKRYINNAIKIFNNENINLSRGIYKKNLGKRTIINSEGVYAEDKFSYNAFDYNIIDNEKNALWDGDESKTIMNNNKQTENVKRIRLLKIKDTPKTGDVKFLLGPRALAQLLNAFIFNVDGENVVNKKSIFKDKLNDKIFDKKITIIDSGIGNYVNSRKCDDEGTPCKETKIVVNGILKNFLLDSYYGNIMKKKSTGNASRSYSSTPGISPNNIIFSKGKYDIKDIFSSINKGIFVNDLLGAHTMDSQTGLFSLGVTEGHIIEEGRIKYAVKDTMVSGNIFDLLRNVEKISNKIEHVGNGEYMPHMLFNKIKVIGR